MNSIKSAVDRVVARVQMSRYAQHERVVTRRDREAHDRASMHRSGIAVTV